MIEQGQAPFGLDEHRAYFQESERLWDTQWLPPHKRTEGRGSEELR